VDKQDAFFVLCKRDCDDDIVSISTTDPIRSIYFIDRSKDA